MRDETWTLDDARRAFEEDRLRAREVASGLDADGFNRRARPGVWSVGECVEHLIVVGAQLLPRVDAALDAAHASGWTAEPGHEIARTSWLDRTLVRMMGPKSDLEPRFPLRAPAKFRPRAEALDPADVLARFDALASDLVRLVERGRGLDLARVRIASVIFPLVRAQAGAWIAGLAAHQDRHLLQAARARGAR